MSLFSTNLSGPVSKRPSVPGRSSIDLRRHLQGPASEIYVLGSNGRNGLAARFDSKIESADIGVLFCAEMKEAGAVRLNFYIINS